MTKWEDGCRVIKINGTLFPAPYKQAEYALDYEKGSSSAASIANEIIRRLMDPTVHTEQR